jgi:peptidoglycan-associated lipoprotein
MSIRYSRLAVCAVLAGPLLVGCASKPKTEPPATQASQTQNQTADAPTLAGAERSGLSQLQTDLAAAAGDRVFFGLDEYALDSEDEQILARQAEWLQRHPDLDVVIAGNCDERGTREYNLALGARRAAAAKTFLVMRGVSEQRLRTVSYGKERPLVLGSGEGAWAQNRNAQTVLIDLGPR